MPIFLQYSRWKTVREMSRMSEFVILMKQYVKSSQMTYYFKCASNGHFTIQWRHRKVVVNGSEVTQLASYLKSHDKANMANVVCLDFIHTTWIYTI